MIAFLDSAPVVEPHGDVFLITATSGGEPVKLMLTFNSLGILGAQCRQALIDRAEERRAAAAKLVPFPKQPKRRANR